jgi:hemerythrin superfamily protein
MTTIFEVLKRAHADLQTLLADLHGTEEGEAKRRVAVLAQAVEHVAAHGRAEQEVVYPLLRRGGERGQIVVRQALADHAEIETALRELVACDVHDELWIAKLEVLRGVVADHVQHEEDEVFAELRRLVDDDGAEALADEFGRRKAVLTGHAA